MKQFFKMLFASMFGFIIGTVVLFFILIFILSMVVSSMSTETVTVKDNSILHLELDQPIKERSSKNTDNKQIIDILFAVDKYQKGFDFAKERYYPTSIQHFIYIIIYLLITYYISDYFLNFKLIRWIYIGTLIVAIALACSKNPLEIKARPLS